MPQFSSLYGARLDEEINTDDRTVLFTTDRRKNAINRGATEFANLTQCLVRRQTFTIIGGTAEYDLNSTSVITAGDLNFLDPDGLEFRYTDASSNVTILARDTLPRRDIDWLNQNEPGWRLSTVASSVMQLPRYHYIRYDGPAQFLGFVPTPSTGSSASAQGMLTYVASAPVMVNDTDQPFTFNSSVRIDLNTYHQGIVHYAAHIMEKLRGDDQRSDRQLQRFMGYVTRYFTDRRIPGGRQIRQAKNYFQRRPTASWGSALAWPFRT